MERQPKLRSARWLDADTRMGNLHRQRLKQTGYSEQDFRGKPVIGILNTWSELNPCHMHFRERAEDVKRGVWQAGGFPVEIPVASLGEPFMKPTTALYRNLLAIEVEEMIRCHPIDGAVLLGGCDKTTPAMLMGAISVDVPSIFVPAGPMLRAIWRGRPLGSGTDSVVMHNEMRAGRISKQEFDAIEEAGARSAGHCMSMGTASTMTALADVLGFTLLGASSIPAPDSRHARMASQSGRCIVEAVHNDLRPSKMLSRSSFHNAVATLMTLGGSTNAVIHLLALSRRAGLDLTLDDFADASAKVPVLANIKPVGSHLMEDFFEAGGLPALLSEISDLIDGEAQTITGRSLAEGLAGAVRIGDDVIRPRSNPVHDVGGLAILKGSLAPEGCVIKRAAADATLFRHRGPALVFDGLADMQTRLDDESLPVTQDTVLILRNVGPVGGPGMPEWGLIPIPKKLLAQGVSDMVRVTDARMSGTHFGTIVLHVSPEAAVGGPLALIRDGDIVSLDVEQRRIDFEVSGEELERRRAAWRRPEVFHQRGWVKLHQEHVLSASVGCDFDFLERGNPSPEPEIS
ncbi:MAG: IlvD/Edd family dehydratase [Rhizobiaceae bacterium]